MKAVKTRFVEPYRKNAAGQLVPNLEILKKNPNTAGVYLIKSNRSGKIIYVGYSSSQLYKTLYRHFQEWNDRQQNRFTYAKTGYTVRVILTTKPRAAILEKHLIQAFRPRDNKTKYENYLSDLENEKAADILQDTPFLGITDDCPF